MIHCNASMNRQQLQFKYQKENIYSKEGTRRAKNKGVWGESPLACAISAGIKWIRMLAEEGESRH